MIKVGIIGAGGIAHIHADAYKQLSSRVKVVGIVDKRLDVACALAKGFQTKAFDDADVLFQSDVDVIDICLPTFLHEEYVVRAAAAGKHVFCEKPIALSLEAADNMIDATEKAGVKFMVGHCLRFWPEYVAVKRRIDQGDLGAVKTVIAARIGSAPNWTWNNWMLVPNLSGGAVIDLHIHDVDIVSWLVGCPVERISAVAATSSRGAMDHIDTLITYVDGTVANIQGDWLVPEGYPFTTFLRVVCDMGTVEYLFRAGRNIEKRNEATSELVLYTNNGGRQAIELIERKDAYFSELEYFIDCIERKEHPKTVTPKCARESLRVVLAARKAAEEGGVIRLAGETEV